MFLWISAIYLVIGKTVFTADANGEPHQSLPFPEPSLPPSEIGLGLIKMMITFFALIALGIGTLWFLRRLIQNRNMRGGGQERSIHIIEKRMLSSKSALYLVEVEGKRVLLAESHLEVRPISGACCCKTLNSNLMSSQEK